MSVALQCDLQYKQFPFYARILVKATPLLFCSIEDMDYDEYAYRPNGRGRPTGWEILPIWLYLVRNLASNRLELSNLNHHPDSRNVRV